MPRRSILSITKTPRAVGSLVAVALLVQAFLDCAHAQGASLGPNDPAPEPRRNFVAAKVNNEAITNREVHLRIADVLEQIDKNELLTPEEKFDQRNAEYWAAVREIVKEKLFLQAAKELGVNVTDEEVQNKVEEEAVRVGGMEKLLRILSDEGVGLDEFQETFRRQIASREVLLRMFGIDTRSGVRGQTSADMFISPREIRSYYGENEERFTETPRVKIRQIVVLDPIAAGSVVRQLRAGADFEAMVKEHSLDFLSNEDGGRVPMVTNEDGSRVWVYATPGDFYERVEKVAFELSEGEISDPIEVLVETGRKAYFILKVEDSIPGRKIPLRDVQKDIRADLEELKFTRNVEQITLELLREAFIEPRGLFADLDLE